MEMILVDWTRMGRTFCVAGVVAEGLNWKTVRPLRASAPTRRGGAPSLWGIIELLLNGPQSAPLPRNVGWLPDQVAGLRRWDIVELTRPKAAAIEPPHTEDLWVRGLRATGSSASL